MEQYTHYNSNHLEILLRALQNRAHWETCRDICRSRLALATEIAEIYESYGHIVTARIHEEPYSIWCRGASCLPWKMTPADMLRVITPSLTADSFMTIMAQPN